MKDDLPPEVIVQKYQQIVDRFPDVPVITPKEVTDDFDKYLLVDVREPEEIQISKIPGALNREDLYIRLENKESWPTQPIVAYCAAGHRSGLFLQELSKKFGDLPVYNLMGGILNWCWQVGGVVDAQGNPVKRVFDSGPSWRAAVPEGYVTGCA